MGRITIGKASVKLDDRSIAHLELVIVAKLRRRESFVFTWRHDVSLGGGRESKWVSPESDIDFRFDSRARTMINPAWVEALMSSANSPAGLWIVPEPDPATELDPIAAAMWPTSSI
ncbi:hypothetical protein [Microbacterium oleivorans]|uniref:DUF7882 domain-containing protein n=1 Tax=Microbacterium oleivorans TaxID=273677 RepID=A0A177KAW8_9MICO|nr:hypothetical protein [Microbacterium oleivorans]OAH50284.1 hypothetical protein AYL44_07410 [Microbacterium oleivorans]